jgi:uncharacterized membrane protein
MKMDTYPEVVAKIINDYLERLKSQLRLVPAQEEAEFMREIQSHIYEAYQQADSTQDNVERILRVLRNLGEPAEVVADRLPEAMVRSGAKRSLPLHVLIGILIALFGIPLGFGGVAVLLGALLTMVGVVVVYYGLASLILLCSVIFLALGTSRIYQPEFLDRLVAAGVIEIDPSMAQFMEALSPAVQGYTMIFFAILFAAAGLTMFVLGKHLVRGLRFLGGLVFDWIRQLAQRVARREKGDGMAFIRRFQRA